jgi:hypothetical protein
LIEASNTPNDLDKPENNTFEVTTSNVSIAFKIGSRDDNITNPKRYFHGEF